MKNDELIFYIAVPLALIAGLVAFVIIFEKIMMSIL